MKEQATAENILPFSVVPGGLPPKGDNWLSELPLGTCFLGRAKNGTSSELTSFMVASDKFRSIMLGVHMGTKREEHVWEDPERFSKQWELVEVLHTPDTEAGDTSNGSSERRPPDMDSHEEPPGEPQDVS